MTQVPPLSREVVRQGLTATAGARLMTSAGLEIGDVVQVAVELTDKQTGSPFWWKTFRVVTGIANARWVSVLTLKMHPDFERDHREIDIEKDVVTFLPEPKWPQGVAAMHMKLLAQGKIEVRR